MQTHRKRLKLLVLKNVSYLLFILIRERLWGMLNIGLHKSLNSRIGLKTWGTAKAVPE